MPHKAQALARFALCSAASAALVLTACSTDGGGDAATPPDGGSAAAAGATAGTGGRTNGESGRSAGGTGGSAGTRPRDGGSGGAAGASGRAGATAGSSGASGNGNAGAIGRIGGCAVFTADDAWNRDISGEPADAAWTARIQRLVGDIDIHPDYGNSGDEHYGIPINVVPAAQPKVAVVFDDYPEESDPGPYPFPEPASAKIEGGTADECDGDCHLLAVQQGDCKLYEGYACRYENGWHCANGAIWDLSSNSYGQREKGWTSADAAGLPIAVGLVRYDEVQSGEIRHAIRFTVRCTRNRFVAPATHQAVPGSCDPSAEDSPPMGLRVRLRADYDLSGLSESARVVARAMQRYGLILADNGSNFYFQGEDHPGWTDDDVEPLKDIPASAFEALTPGELEQ